MQRLKYKILLQFCLVALISITLIGVVISVLIQNGVSKLANNMSVKMTQQIYDTLNLPHQTYLFLIQNKLQVDVQDICSDSNLINGLEQTRLKLLQAELHDKGVDMDLDFIILFDLHGHIEASFPHGINEIALEKHFQTWELIQDVKAAIQDEDANQSKGGETFWRIDARLLNDLGLPDGLTNALSYTVVRMIKNDFDEPMGICLVGKLLNHYDPPLRHLNEMTGYACAVYIDTNAIAQVGFKMKGQADFNLARLQIETELTEKVYKTSQKVNQEVILNGNPYITSCEAIRTSLNQPVGMLCVSFPRKRVIYLKESILNNGLEIVRKLQLGVVAIGLVCVIVFALISLLIASKITKPIRKTIDFSNKIAQGDLTASIQTRVQDEIGALIAVLRRMSTNISDMVVSIREAADNVAALSHELKAQASLMFDRSDEQAAAAASAASAMNRLTDIVAHNTKYARDTNQIALNSVADAQKGGRAIIASINEMKGIGRKVKFIEEIIRKTQILSLNASIEAAHAGEHGRGFSIVAAEIRALSERTRQASAEINQLSKSSVVSAAATEKILTGLIKSIQTNSGLLENINQANTKQNREAAKVNAAIHQLDRTTQDNLALVQTMTAMAEQLSDLSDLLQNTIAVFRVDESRDDRG